MSTKTQTPSDTSAPVLNEAKDKANAAQANATAEANAFATVVTETSAQASKLGALAIDNLAKQFGESCNHLGRPTVPAWFALVSAMAGQENLTHERRTDIVRKAMAAHKAKHGAHLKFKACASQKAKAGLGKGSASYSLNMPTAVSIAAE